MKPFPVKVPLSYRIIFLCVLFTLFACIIGYGVFFTATQPIVMEDEEPMPLYFKIPIILFASIVEAGVLYMILPLWKRIFTGSGAMTLTEAGIENTFMLFTVFAFWTTLRIDCIPWSALQELDEKDYAVDVKLLPPHSVGRIARFLLKISGFQFRIGRISKKDLEHYRQIALSRNAHD